MVKLSAEEKERIAAMSSPADMDYEERKRQYAALRRAVYRSASPGLMAKYTLSSDADRPLVFICIGSYIVQCVHWVCCSKCMLFSHLICACKGSL